MDGAAKAANARAVSTRIIESPPKGQPIMSTKLAPAKAANYNLRRANGDRDAHAVEVAAREGGRTGHRPAAAGPRERIRHVHPEEVDVDEAIDVDEAAGDQVAVLLAHRHAI